MAIEKSSPSRKKNVSAHFPVTSIYYQKWQFQQTKKNWETNGRWKKGTPQIVTKYRKIHMTEKNKNTELDALKSHREEKKNSQYEKISKKR